MTTREQAQWVLAVLLAGRSAGAEMCVVGDVIPTYSRRFGGGPPSDEQRAFEAATDALERVGYYIGSPGIRADKAAIRRAIRLLDEGAR